MATIQSIDYSSSPFATWMRNTWNMYSVKSALIAFIGIGFAHAQVATESWSIGAGFVYPRYFSVNIDPTNSNFGGYITEQRNVSEHVGFRARESFNHLEGKWGTTKEHTNLFAMDLSLLYYLVPCEPITPYFLSGIGGNIKQLSNQQSPSIDHSTFGSQIHIGFGSEFRINSEWSTVGEFGYYQTTDSDLDGTIVPTEMGGRDSYMSFSLGVNFKFGKGQPSNLCYHCVTSTVQIYRKDSVTKVDTVNYQRIEDLIIKHIPRETLKETNRETIREVPNDRYIQTIGNDKMVLVGVNFDFDKSDLLAASYPVLDKSIELLKNQPKVKIEIEGYTDYVGSLAYNRNLSVERAERVKAYFIAQGIEESRIVTFGYGKRNPAQDNVTSEGREMNRRITIRIIK